MAVIQLTNLDTPATFPIPVAIAPDGKHVYVGNMTYDVLDGARGFVSVIDTATKVVVATVTVGNNPVGIAFTPDRHAYVDEQWQHCLE